MNSVVIYGDVSVNVIDGSSTWLISITEVASRIFDDVHLQLKVPAVTDRVIAGLKNIPNVYIHGNELRDGEAPSELNPAAAAQAVAELVKSTGADVVIARGFEVCNAFAMRGEIARILWAYVTDLPYPITRISDRNRTRLVRIAARSRRMFAQTEAARSYLEAIAPQSAGKTVLMHPMIPDDGFRGTDSADVASSQFHDAIGTLDRPLRLIYAGKLALDWRTLEMLALPRALAALGVHAELQVIGDKFQREPSRPSWRDVMRRELEAAHADGASGVTWLGGLPRSEVIELLKSADIGLGWRSARLDSSIEISTKALEYSAAGCAPLINETADHRLGFGENYPLFVLGDDSIEQVAEKIAANLERLNLAKALASKFAERYSMGSAQERLSEYFRRSGALTPKSVEGITESPRRKLAIVSHDFKFLGELVDQLAQRTDYVVRTDPWSSLRDHDVEQSEKIANWADIVFCEWAGPSLVWYSKHKKPGSRLIARLHAFELRGNWLKDVDFSQVDCVVFVSDFYRQKGIDQLGIDPVRTAVIPNSLDLSDFDRVKLPGSQFHVGLVGIVSYGKRPDRALDVIERLVQFDDRYILHIKGRNPWEYPHEWNNPVQRHLYSEFYARIANSDILKRSVAFESFGADIASWYRRIGIILSPSEFESFHLAPAEGMASRAVPMFWQREGVSEVYGEQWLENSTSAIADRILAVRDGAQFTQAGEAAREYVKKWDTLAIFDNWLSVFSGSMP